jgi:hypothetical protein
MYFCAARIFGAARLWAKRVSIHRGAAVVCFEVPVYQFSEINFFGKLSELRIQLFATNSECARVKKEVVGVGISTEPP